MGHACRFFFLIMFQGLFPVVSLGVVSGSCFFFLRQGLFFGIANRSILRSVKRAIVGVLRKVKRPKLCSNSVEGQGAPGLTDMEREGGGEEN